MHERLGDLELIPARNIISSSSSTSTFSTSGRSTYSLSIGGYMLDTKVSKQEARLSSTARAVGVGRGGKGRSSNSNYFIVCRADSIMGVDEEAY